MTIISLLLPPPVSADQELEEVTVTARKREESLQSVPMAVSSFNAEQLTNSQVTNITDLERMSPNITMSETNGLVAGAVQVFMRGIGNDPGFDQGVGIYIDDVYLNRTSGALLEVYDVERIEILKGPQGNLYGRNTIGGAIKYVNREPGEELRADIELKYGSYNLRKAKGNISGPLISGNLYGGLGFLIKQTDGIQTNRFDGSEWWAANLGAIRGNLMWTPTDALKIKLAADYFKDDSDPYVPVRFNVDTAAVNDINQASTQANLLTVPVGLFTEDNDTSLPSNVDKPNTAFGAGYDKYEITTSTVNLTFEWDISDQWSAKSVTALRQVDNVQPFDFDGSDQKWIETINDRTQRDISQEFQFNYSSDSVAAVLGLYYLNGRRENARPGFTEQTARLRGVQFHNKTTFDDDRDLDSYSAYFNMDWDFIESWQVSVGGRYTLDEKELNQTASVELGDYGLAIAPGLFTWSVGPVAAMLPGMEGANAGGVDPRVIGYSGVVGGVRIPFSPTPIPLHVSNLSEPLANEESWSNFSPSAKLTWFATDETMVYTGVATGFKSGGFQTSGGAGPDGKATIFDPETVIAYTLGSKSDLFDRSLRINFEAFYNDYQDKQLAAIRLTTAGLDQLFQNVGEMSTYGAEIETTWLPPVDGLMFNVNVGWLQWDIKEAIFTDKNGNDLDVTDTTAIGFAPEWTAMGAVQYDISLNDFGWLTLGADASYRSESYTNSPIDLTSEFEKSQVQEAHTIYNAVIAWRSPNEQWRVALEGRNLDDTRVLTNTFKVGPVITGGYNMPRIWAVSAAYRF